MQLFKACLIELIKHLQVYKRYQKLLTLIEYLATYRHSGALSWHSFEVFVESVRSWVTL